MDIILYLLIGLWYVWIGDKYFGIGSSEVHINGNITAEAYSNDIRLKCSFTLGEEDVFFSITLTAENSTTASFNEIAGYRKNPFLTPFGMNLFGNYTSIHFEETTKSFMLSFNNLTCRHERQYKCLLYVATTTSAKTKEFESDIMWISVTVLPLKPEMTLPTKVNDLSGGKRYKRSATIMPKNNTHKQDFIEGDNITFMCEGDVGRPEGSFEWQKIYAYNEKFTYSNIFTKTIPKSCSYDGNSTLTMQVTGDDNQAVIRCIVKSEVSHVSVYEDSEPLRIQFQVRIPVIELRPDKTVFLEGDAVRLKCQSEGNPSPSYSWLKGNEINETIIAYTDSFVIENANITDSGLYTCYTNNSIDGKVHKEFNSTYIIIAEQSTSPSTSTLSPLGVDITKDILIAVIIAGVVVFVTVILFVIVVCIHKKRKTSSAKFSENGLKMTNTKKKNNENKDTDNEVEQQQKETDRRRTKDAHSRDNSQNEDTYADAPDGVYDKPGDRRHIEEKNCEPFDHVDTAKNTSLHRKNKETDKEFNDQQQKGTYVYVETEIRRTKDTYSRDNPQNEDTYADAPDGVYDKPGDRRHIEEKNCESFDHVDTAKNISAESNKPTESKGSTIMLNRNPKSHDQSNSSGYESVEMDGKTPVLLSKSNGNEHADAVFVKQHNEIYLQNQKEEDEKGKNSHSSHQNVEYAQVDEAKKLKNKRKQNDTDQETVEMHEETKFESEEMRAKTDVHDENVDEPKLRNNENSDEETESTVTTSDHIMGRVNPAFENDDVSDKDGTIKGVMASPTMRMAGPPIEHTQIETTNANSKDNINLSQTEDDADDDDDNYCNAIHNSKLLTSVRDTKQIENINTEIQEGIDKRPCRTVDNAGYFDTTRHVESLTSSEHTRQKENINAKTQEGIEEIPGRVIDNAEYFDTTLRLMDQQTNGGQITAKKDDQTKTYTNQAFETEEDQLADEFSSQFRLLDGLQDGGERNQNVD